jgi:hypothetical protein
VKRLDNHREDRPDLEPGPVPVIGTLSPFLPRVPVRERAVLAFFPKILAA